MIPTMSPALLLALLVASLVALLPVWRLHVAGWPARWLLAAWLVLALGTFAAVRFPGAARFLVPILVLSYVAPFVAGPERLARVLGGGAGRGVVIDVTPRRAEALPPPREDEDPADRPDAER